jgi:ubiquitin C-terminal hydrolase
MWHCPTCKEQVQAHKKMEIFKLPEVLIVHLKRFSHSRVHRQKLNVPVDFPLAGLDLEQYLHGDIEKGRSVYNLVGVSKHSGVSCPTSPLLRHLPTHGGCGRELEGGWVCSHTDGHLLPIVLFQVMSGGHYTATCQNFKDLNWYSFDDSYVTQQTQDRAKSDASYVLFYQRAAAQ